MRGVKLAVATALAFAVIGHRTELALAADLKIEPLEQRTYTDVLEPCLDWELSAEAKEPCRARQEGGKVLVGNGFLELRLDGNLGGMTLVNRLTGENLELAGKPVLRAEFVEGTMEEATKGAGSRWLESSALQGVKVACEANEAAAKATIAGAWQDIGVMLAVEARRNEAIVRLRASFKNTGGKDIILREIAFGWPEADRQRATDEIKIAKQEKGGFLATVEFPFLQYPGLGYRPGWPIPAGAAYEAEPVAFVSYRAHNGESTDRAKGLGLWEATGEYARAVSPYRHDLIVNHNSWYSGVRWPDDAQLALFRSVGGNSYQLETPDLTSKKGTDPRTSEGRAGNEDMDKRFQEVCGRCTAHGIRPVTYSHFYVCYNRQEKFECFMDPVHRGYMDWIQGVIRRYGIKGYGADFTPCGHLHVGNCSDTAHGHLGKPYGIYRQNRWWFDLLARLRKEGMEELLAAYNGAEVSLHSIARLDFSHVTPDVTGGEPGPAVSLDHSFADRYRAYMLRFLAAPTVFVAPYRVYLGIGHAGGGGFDVRGWRYSLVGGFSTIPFAHLGNLHDMPDPEIAFTREWVEWTRTNRDILMRTGRVLFDVPPLPQNGFPSPFVVVGFNHVRGDGRGFFSVHNGTFQEHTVDLEIRVADAAGAPVLVRRIYPPADAALPGPKGGAFAQGDHLVTTIPPRSVHLFRIGPPDFFGGGTVRAVPAATPAGSLYLGNWKVVPGGASLATNFTPPEPMRRCLADRANWPKLDKRKNRDVRTSDSAPYLVLLMSYGKASSAPLVMPDKEHPWPKEAKIAVHLNEKEIPAQPFFDNKGGFYAARLDSEGIESRRENALQVTLPDTQGLVFHGAFIEVPDRYRE